MQSWARPRAYRGADRQRIGLRLVEVSQGRSGNLNQRVGRIGRHRAHIKFKRGDRTRNFGLRHSEG